MNPTPQLRSSTLLRLGVLALFPLGALLPPSLFGQDLPSGLEVAQRVNARPEGEWVSRTLALELTDRGGATRNQQTRGFRKFYGPGEARDKKSVIFYQEPANIRDTAFLTFDYADETRDDDQWLYLPALRRVRRVSASQRGDYFLGTDLTYEEIKKETKVAIEDYTWTSLRREEVDGHSCVVVESVPVDAETAKELGHGRVVRWIDDTIWMARRAEYYDQNGNLQRTLSIAAIEQIDGIWTATRIEAENHKTGHRSVLVFRDIDYEEEVDDEFFTQGALSRGLR